MQRSHVRDFPLCGNGGWIEEDRVVCGSVCGSPGDWRRL